MDKPEDEKPAQQEVEQVQNEAIEQPLNDGPSVPDDYNNEANQQVNQEEPTMQFSDEEVTHLREIFDLFDREKQGSISIKDLEAIMQSLNRDPEEAKQLLQSIRQARGQETFDEDRISFEDFINMMQQVENKLAKDDPHNLNR